MLSCVLLCRNFWPFLFKMYSTVHFSSFLSFLFRFLFLFCEVKSVKNVFTRLGVSHCTLLILLNFFHSTYECNIFRPKILKSKMFCNRSNDATLQSRFIYIRTYIIDLPMSYNLCCVCYLDTWVAKPTVL